jgi:hypothetical protein
LSAALPASPSSYSPPSHQREVDAMMAAIRAEQAAAGAKRPLFKPAPAKAGPSTSPLDHRIAEELQVIRRRLDQLGDTLASDPILAHRHGVALQGLDLTNQILDHLAQVIGSEDKGLAADQVTMADLRSRLQRRPLGL